MSEIEFEGIFRGVKIDGEGQAKITLEISLQEVRGIDFVKLVDKILFVRIVPREGETIGKKGGENE